MGRGRGSLVWLVVLMLAAGRGALAGGPRYVTGYPYFNNQGNAVHWNTNSLLYFTDPGGLSASVNHAAADALVEAAAGVWNIPQASITVGRGGALAEHVSGANVYLSSNGMVYPADVANTNSAAIAIAVIYDTDGSVTDTLLGSGASGPLSCRQNAVTETVDQFDPAGYITHAIVVLNGRCTGPVAAQQLQMQYQLERVFGRVLGLAWSQVNDNVLMGMPAPTYNQALHWPIMHPVDVICGSYTYQCLPNPFTLRADDIAGMVGLYGVGDGTTEAGKQGSLVGAEAVTGSVTFPTGQGMAGVNVLARRETLSGSQEGWYTSSAVTGTYFRRSGTSAFVTADRSVVGSEGTYDGSLMGRYTIGYVPVQSGQVAQNVQISVEAVNPLYVGALSVGAYPLGAVSPSGSAGPQTVVGAFTDGFIYEDFTVKNAVAGCGTGQDGTASAPAAMAPSGWWTGVICGYGHAAYTALAVRAGRTLTVEVTALDEQGFATTAKAMPVMGMFAAGDQGGDLPSVAVAGVAFDSEEVGTTAMRTAVPAGSGQVSQMRLGVADQRGDGRPDYAYQARVFYADTLLPGQVGAAGGTVTISGSGFRQGNVVLVNGVGAAVTSVTANQLVVTMPSAVVARAVGGTAVDVEVRDLASGADTVMSGVLVYGVTPAKRNGMKLVSAPGGSVYVGDVAGTAFAVEVVGPDGSTPVQGEQVVFSAGAGSALFGACGAATCTVTTGADGMARSQVTPETAGTVTLTAVDGTLEQAVDVTVQAQDGRMTVVSAPPGAVLVGAQGGSQFAVQVVDASGRAASGRLITFSVTAGMAMVGGCSASVCGIMTDSSGTAGVGVTPTGVGPITLTAVDGDLQQSVSLTGTSNVDVMRVLSAPGATSQVGEATSYFTVQLLHSDGVQPDKFEHVIFTAPAGVTLSGCGGTVCDVTTSGAGIAQTTINAALAGTYVVQAAFGAVTQSVTVTFVVNTLQLQVVTGPVGNQVVGQETSVPFTVRTIYTSGEVLAGALVVIQGPKGGVVLDACGGYSCSVYTDGNGMVSTGVRTLRTGAITLDAVMGSVVATTTYTGVPPADVVTFVALPAAGFPVGNVVTAGVRVVLPDGVTAAAGVSVTFTVTNGAFVFSGCAVSGCVVVTDADGKASVSGLASGAGASTVQAAAGGGVATATLTAAAAPDELRLVSAPSDGRFVGAVDGTAFAVQVLAGDGSGLGSGPASGRYVTLFVAEGAAGLGACGGGSRCVVVTDAEGMVGTGVTPLGAGRISLRAVEGGAEVTASFVAVAEQESLTAVGPVVYVAEGARVRSSVGVRAVLNGAVAEGIGVRWSSGVGVAVDGAGSMTDGAGVASMGVWIGPVVGEGSVEACAWAGVCVPIGVVGVSADALQVAVVTGGAQTVPMGSVAGAVTAMVTDGAGHPVVGAGVQVYQTVTEVDVACPARGRCPVGRVLGESETVLVSAGDGTVTFEPLTVAGMAAETKVLLTVGVGSVAEADVVVR